MYVKQIWDEQNSSFKRVYTAPIDFNDYMKTEPDWYFKDNFNLGIKGAQRGKQLSRALSIRKSETEGYALYKLQSFSLAGNLKL